MVDAVVSFVVQRLGDYLIQEANFLGEVRNEVETLKKDLEWMHSFIKDAEDKQVDNALIRQWISDIRDIAYDSEDVLNKFILQVHDEQTSNMLINDVKEGETSNLKTRRGYLASIKKCSCIFAKTSSHKKSSLCSKGKEKSSLYSIGKEIEALKKRLGDVSYRREFFGLQNINTKRNEESLAVGRLKQLRKTTSFSFEENVVGYEDDTNKLLAKLLDHEPIRFIISIWGTGGLGKTTLARKLYHNQAVKNKFDRCAWVSMSQDYNTQDLLLRIIKSFRIGTTTENLERMGEEDLERYLHDSLQGRSYLLVIDDVWHKEAWSSLKRAFPDNRNGSRVIITTRIKDVALRSDEHTHIHELRFLRPEESWQLFCEKAFQNLNVDQGLEKLGREMVDKCGGLPLAIVVLGGLLSTKKPQEWHLVRDNIWQNLSNDSIEISYLLTLSFNDLSYQLKLCFLYLSHFPEDYVIDTQELIHLWVAEGYIPHDEEIMEDMAHNNLNELINRSLIQQNTMRLGRVISCQVHDLLRDLAIRKAKELNFVQIYDEIKNSTGSSNLSCRRQAVYSGIQKCLWLLQCNPFLCSLLIFNIYQERAVIDQILPTLFTRLRFLRVLNFKNFTAGRIWSLPEDIGKLIHLKYLGLNNTSVSYIPLSILNLSYLETLVVGDHTLVSLSLPTEICKLKRLRHLTGYLMGQDLQIDNMSNLQTLKWIGGYTWTETNPETLVNLRELGIDRYVNKEKKFTFDSVSKLKSLRILSVRLLNEDHFFASLQPLSGCGYLLKLSLHGRINKLPGDMHALLPNLQGLSLRGSNLIDDPMPTLEKLLNLTELELGYDCYCGKKLVCTAKGFPRLEVITLDVIDLEDWHVEEEAMPMLRGMKLINNTHIFRIPERLRSIPPPTDWE